MKIKEFLSRIDWPGIFYICLFIYFIWWIFFTPPKETDWYKLPAGEIEYRLINRVEDGEMEIREFHTLLNSHVLHRYEYKGDHDCGDFENQETAQEFFDNEGGNLEYVDHTDYHELDSDGDLLACETLPKKKQFLFW